MEHKQSTGLIMDMNDQGLVEAIWSVFGVLDTGGDVVHPGAFTKTFVERGGKVKVLDAHQSDSLLNVIGRPVAMRELSRAELPPVLLERYPEATGGAWAKVQFLLDTPEGAGAFARLKAGAVDEWSFGYEVLDKDYSEAKGPDGQPVMARNLRTIKLYELSPVIWGMNEATMTTGAKAAPAEAKPWGAFHEGDKWNIYKVDADGNRTGEVLYSHDTEDAARAQVRALYASEESVNQTGEGSSVALAGKEDYPWDECISDQLARYGDQDTAERVCGAIRAGQAMQRPTLETLAAIEKELGITPPEVKSGRRLNAAKVEALRARIAALREHVDGLEKDLASWANYEDEEIVTLDTAAKAAVHSATESAGPATPPTVEVLKAQLELLQR